MQCDSESRSRSAGTRSDDHSRAYSHCSSPGKAGAPEAAGRRGSASGERPASAKSKTRRSPAPGDVHSYAGSRIICPCTRLQM